MIKANELRVGNWLMGSKPFQVKFIYTENTVGCGEGDPYFVFTEPPYEPCLEAIPLTPEILEKAGFVKQITKSASGFTRYVVRKMMLLVDDSENPFSNIEAYYERHFSIYECVGSRKDLKLHQLQNLYFALTGEELNIAL